MKRLYQAYMSFWLAVIAAGCVLGAVLNACDVDRDNKAVAAVTVIALIPAGWNYARSRGRSGAWVLTGVWVWVVLPMMKDLSSTMGAPNMPRTSVGKGIYNLGERVHRGAEWLYEKIRYHPRDPDPPLPPATPALPEPPTSS